MDCFGVHTNERTHEIIRSNLDRAPMYNGGITTSGPRYCPSIETKIVRFAEKSSHHLFLEPEGWHTREMYVQGANTSLPEDVQLEMLRSIPALRNVEIMRAGYAIEYDYLPGRQVHATLETKALRNLYLAGQIIGTTGYEEAAALGIMAGNKAARRSRDEGEVVWRRDEAYIGVLIDDLVTREMDEPYRTLLGHFRHEIGHYYWDVLVAGSSQLERYRQLFGDERADYGEALAAYHADGPKPNWEENYISAYATAHPWEDWAESWAHYLHMVYALEPASDYALEARVPNERWPAKVWFGGTDPASASSAATGTASTPRADWTARATW